MRCIKAHGDRYIYDKFIYIGGRTKATIICKEHGDFQQTPEMHMSGQGCPACGLVKFGKTRSLKIEEFLERAYAVHGNSYEYDKDDYKNVKEKFNVKCNLHGNKFLISPELHLRGTGCPICYAAKRGKSSRSNTEDFIEKAKLVHGDKYDYSVSEYVKSDKKLNVRCIKHDTIFSLRPNRHLMGDGCTICAGEATGERCRKSNEQFIADAKFVHGDKYDYSITKYVRIKDRVDILCREHGVFTQLPGVHLSGGGCASCAQNGFDKNKDGILYVLQSSNLTKIGISNRSVDIRLHQINRQEYYSFEVVKFYEYSGHTVRSLELSLLKEMRASHEQPTEKFDGYTECFYNVDHEKLFTRIEELINLNGQHSPNANLAQSHQ